MSPHAPRTEPYVRISRIRLPPRVPDGEALVGPRMGDARPGEPTTGERGDPRPCRAILLAAPPKRAQPQARDMIAERDQGLRVGRHRVIGEEPAHHLAQPTSLLIRREVQPSSQPIPDRRQPRAHPVSARLPLQQEEPASAASTDVREAEKVERLRLALATL